LRGTGGGQGPKRVLFAQPSMEIWDLRITIGTNHLAVMRQGFDDGAPLD
jgi:hypothetical protein